MIILQILKIIGIVLACIIGLALLIVLLVLFVPVNYSISVGVHSSEIKLGAGCGWLLHLISFRLKFEGKELSYALTAAGIKIISTEGTGEKKEKPVKERTAKEKNEEGETELFQTDFPGISPENRKKEEKNGHRTPAEVISDKLKALSGRITGICERVKRIYNKTKTVKYVVCAPVTKRALDTSLGRLKKIFLSLRPRSIKGDITIGTEDPSKSALIYGALASVCTQLSGKLYIHPELKSKRMDVDAIIKGRIFIGYIALMALGIITDKNVKRVVRYIRRNF